MSLADFWWKRVPERRNSKCKKLWGRWVGAWGVQGTAAGSCG